MSLIRGDCLEAMAAMDAGSVDAVCCDPPYALTDIGRTLQMAGNRRHSKGFMGKSWDAELPGVDAWTEILRVLKPSHYLLAFGGTRTWHRLACAIEDAGFEIRDTLMWLYGSGFPKGKSCLKPAWEPIILARKPGPKRELGIDCCRIGTDATRRDNHGGTGDPTQWRTGNGGDFASGSPSGRWPANLILECTCDETREGTAGGAGHIPRTGNTVSVFGPNKHAGGGPNNAYAGPGGKEPVRIHTDPNCPCAMLDAMTGTLTSGLMASDTVRGSRSMYGQGNGKPTERDTYGDSGGASRFFFRADYKDGE